MTVLILTWSLLFINKKTLHSEYTSLALLSHYPPDAHAALPAAPRRSADTRLHSLSYLTLGTKTHTAGLIGLGHYTCLPCVSPIC